MDIQRSGYDDPYVMIHRTYAKFARLRFLYKVDTFRLSSIVAT